MAKQKIWDLYWQIGNLFHDELKRLDGQMVAYLKSRSINYKMCEKHMIGFSPMRQPTFILDALKTQKGFDLECGLASKAFVFD